MKHLIKKPFQLRKQLDFLQTKTIEYQREITQYKEENSQLKAKLATSCDRAILLKQNILLGQQNDELERQKQTEENLKTEIAKLQSKLSESKIDCMEILEREGVAVSLRNDQMQVVATNRDSHV